MLETVHMTNAMRQCIDVCLECHRICLETVVHGLGMGGEQARQDHIRLLLDCAEICQTSANFMSRHSGLHARVCAVCAEACQICAAECSQFSGDAMMVQCAEICRRCAEACRRMSPSPVA